jgi:hypothetical protein
LWVNIKYGYSGSLTVRVYTKLRINLTSKRLGLVALCFLVVALGLGISVRVKKPPRVLTIEAHSSIPLVHAEDESGCATCHTLPLSGSCTSCHPSPPTLLDSGVSFPHHDRDEGGPPDTCSDESCHDAGSDIRYVDTPNASHSFCNDCHSGDMSHS